MSINPLHCYCPVCQRTLAYEPGENATSRYHKGLYLCSDCGVREALQRRDVLAARSCHEIAAYYDQQEAWLRALAQHRARLTYVVRWSRVAHAFAIFVERHDGLSPGLHFITCDESLPALLGWCAPYPVILLPAREA